MVHERMNGIGSGVAWQIYEHSPEAVVKAGNFARRVFETAVHLRSPVFEFDGKLAAGEGVGTVLAVGPRAAVEVLIESFLEKIDRRRDRGSLHLRRVNTLLSGSAADIRFVYLDRVLLRRFAAGADVFLPEWIGTEVPMSAAPLSKLENSRNMRRSMKRAASAGMSVEVTKGLQGYEEFLQKAHVPSVRRRFGTAGVSENAHQIRRWLRRGGLVRIKRRGTPVLAVVYRLDGTTLRVGAQGMFVTDSSALKQGAGVLLYSTLFELATKLSVLRVDLGGVRPFYSDGVLLFKQRWGAVVSRPTTPNGYALYADAASTAFNEWRRLRRPIAWDGSGLREVGP